ncbi:MAG TPA: hypothetical protein VFV34_18020, partial [Blastocatellia bacterium]|nr:hypothetical protein [Blastocatellia bacterium]
MNDPQSDASQNEIYNAQSLGDAAAVPQVPVEEPAKLGPLQRLTGVIFSPGETFADMKRKPS